MKKRVCMILSLMLAIFAMFSLYGCDRQPEQDSGDPAKGAAIFTSTDVSAVVGDLKTVSDYIEKLRPGSYSWEFWNTSGETRIALMNGSDVMVELSVTAPIEMIGADGYSALNPTGTAETLDEGFLSLPARLAEAYWNGSAPCINEIRGVKVGDSAQTVLDSYLREGDGNTLYGITAINPQADDAWNTRGYVTLGGQIIEDNELYDYAINYTYSDIKSPEDWLAYDSVTYYIRDDKVELIAYSYFLDAVMIDGEQMVKTENA